MVSEYERQRDLNIARNKALLQELGLDKPFFEPKETARKTKATNKRKAPEPDVDSDQPALKTSRLNPAGDEPNSGPTRRSARNRGKTVDYKSEQTVSAPMPISFKSGIRVSGNEGPLGSGGGTKRTHNPKTYGSIPGVDVGTWWETREGCSNDAIHAPWVGGIAVGPKGAYSVALSGGYDDDVDLGYAFTYTGSGGRDLKGTKAAPKNLRTAPQSCDQDFDNNFNRTLQLSAETKKPVRVIRGYKLKSPYGPSEGYRYDGLYEVEKAWSEKGLNKGGFLVCKFAFKRLPGQPPLLRRVADDGDVPKVAPDATEAGVEKADDTVAEEDAPVQEESTTVEMGNTVQQSKLVEPKDTVVEEGTATGKEEQESTAFKQNVTLTIDNDAGDLHEENGSVLKVDAITKQDASSFEERTVVDAVAKIL